MKIVAKSRAGNCPVLLLVTLYRMNSLIIGLGFFYQLRTAFVFSVILVISV